MSRLLARWRRLESKPLGAWLFSRRLAAMVPYSGTIVPRVVRLEEGLARVRMHDRRAIRNHLDSVHAAALMNLGELASGLALLSALPDERRAILVRFRTEFTKKGRGTLEAEGTIPADVDLGRADEVEVVAVVRDGAGDEVARVRADWKLGGPAPPSES
ncbi:MAG: DUF4442 domain-containing protein [Planctomycetota bacterium JB042]